ncbi:FKBP-type peptidyl-prolyl isomerase-like protein [Arcticibacter tournemirensis]|uniref:Peptidyl-prolyl cis-trans isomerase n=1 Tax=Arcticibacter tournemirensis TaxID=699437 RepID=A0A5M9HJM9_9SPHI|nr:FKBP-type peptidyl-prolyl cis-trans isomerase [Arcticibacter tournemirensis]KAA8486705.1 hypothetical protein F1649_00390 [Arcticibacter tournemirensis]TQM49243.1 FKBP-type peptidyl-prolyl isomerase-like protein [Arcticibacter tournemirensis]
MKVITYKLSLVMFLLVAVTAGCKKEYDNIEVEDEKNIQEYIQKNGLNMQVYDTTGIYYQVTKMGTGSPIDYTQQLPVVYTVKSLDGVYSSQDTILNHYANYFGYYSPASLRDLMKDVLKNQGGSIRIILPSRKAYGRGGNTSLGIPGNASLDFTVSILEKSKLPAYEDQMIKKYLGTDLPNYTKSEDGIYYKISEAGTGKEIRTDSTVTVNYSGSFMNGTVFDSYEGYSSQVDGFINAWKKILPLLKEGGSVKFVTPSSSAYGLQGSSSIPAFSPLGFDVKVTKVGQ